MIFVIINEWVDIVNNTSSEIVGASYFTSEDEAHEALALIAEAMGEEIGPEDNYFTSENDPHLQFQEYYIQELARA